MRCRGYYFSKPLLPNEVAEKLRRNGDLSLSARYGLQSAQN